MARGRRGRPPKAPENKKMEHEMKEAARALENSGAATLFFHIRRRKPGSSFFPYWKRKVPVEGIVDIGKWCYEHGGEEYEYRVEVRDGDGVKVDGFPDSDIAAAKEPDLSDLGRGAGGVNPALSAIRQQQEDLQLANYQMMLEKRQWELDRERKKLEKRMKKGDDDEDDEEDEEENGYPYHPYYGAYGMHGYPGYGSHYSPYTPPWMQQPPPWMQQQKKEGPSDAVAMATAFAQIMSAKEDRKDSGLEMMKILAPLLLGNKKDLEPKDYVNMLTPILQESNKASAEANKVLISSMSEMDRAFREKLLEVVMADPNRTEDDVEKFRKWLGLGTDALKEGVKLITGRDSIMGKKREVDVPKVDQKDKRKLPPPKERTEEEKKEPPEERAKKLIVQRIEAFMLAVEEEAHVGSDPGLVAEMLEKPYFVIPESIRDKVESQEVAEIFETLNEHIPEVIQRIMGAVQKDESGRMKEWYSAFWEAVKDWGDDDEGGGDGEPEPEPEPEPPSKEPEPEPEPEPKVEKPRGKRKPTPVTQ